LALNDNQSHRNRAMVHYSKSIHYGEVFLKENDLSLEVLIKSKDPKRLLMDNLDDDEISQKIVLFLAQSIAGMVNLNRDQSLYLTALPAAKSMFDWVCELNPGIYGGACPLFYGAYEAGRPKMLGGNPEKGKEIFLKAIEAYPENYLIRVGYLQFYVVPRGDEDEFNAQAKIIEEFIAMETKEKYWKPLSKKKEVSEKTSRLNLFNATAIKRFQIMKQNKEEIF
ncbi:MAG: TRAP transporter TatT component family protein, partial [Bacteriovoracaceae bacterium]